MFDSLVQLRDSFYVEIIPGLVEDRDKYTVQVIFDEAPVGNIYYKQVSLKETQAVGSNFIISQI